MKKSLLNMCLITLGACSILASPIEQHRIDTSLWEGYYTLDVDGDSALSTWEIFKTHYKISDNFIIEQHITYDNLTGEPIIASGDAYHVKRVIHQDEHSLQVTIVNSSISLESEYFFSITYDEASTLDEANTAGYYYVDIAPPKLITLETTDEDFEIYRQDNSSRYRRDTVYPILEYLCPPPNFDPDRDLTPFLEKISGGGEYQFWELTSSAASAINEYGSLASGVGMSKGSRVVIYSEPVQVDGKVVSNNGEPIYGYAYKDTDPIDSPSHKINYDPGPDYGSHKYGSFWFSYTIKVGSITISKTYYGLPVMIVNDIVFTGKVQIGTSQSSKNISDSGWSYFDERGMTNLFKNNQGLTKIDNPI